MVTIFVHRGGKTEQVTSIERVWLTPASGIMVWVDLAAPSIPESLILSDTFKFHPLSVEDAMSARQYPKAEAYDGYFYVNEVIKVLTVVATIFMPPTLLAGLWGMNVALPRFPGSDAAQFWWLTGATVLMVVGMLGAFRRKRWI